MASHPHSGMIELPSNVHFCEPDSAKRVLDRIAKCVGGDVYERLLTFLPVVPDPDSAVAQFERVLELAEPSWFERFRQFPFLIHYAVLVFGYSKWIGETLIRNPELFDDFVSQRQMWHQPRSNDFYAERLHEIRQKRLNLDLATLLANFKRRQYASIVLRDVLGIASFSDVGAEISALSDVLIEAALAEAERQTSGSARQPPLGSRFAVISLGKLGGNELNYSSDIDLLFLYDVGGEASSHRAREYFIRLAQSMTELLSRHTPEGPIFRIDLRLRPQGSQEELAVSLSHAMHYYQQVAQDWELQALIKARHSAGDPSVTREFLRAVEPQVYRPALNFAAIKTALQSREKMDKRHRRHPRRQRGIDIKLDRGGIRDIEFLVQCLQRVYGGQEPWLRSRGTLFALQKLHDKQHVSSHDFLTLSNAYVFLRTIEHRLQLREGDQKHLLLESASELERMARSVAREGTTAPRPEEFHAGVCERMATIAEIYDRVVRGEASSEDHVAPDRQPTQKTLAHGYSELIESLAHNNPELRDEIAAAALSQHASLNLRRVLNAMATIPEQSAALLGSPTAIRRLLRLTARSDLLASMLARHPSDLRLLEEIDSTGFSVELTATAGLVHSMAALRQAYRREIFLSCARDVLQSRNIYAALLEKSAIADAAIRAATQLAGGAAGFAVMALGRLGSREFEVLSDADLLFLCDESVPRQQAQRTAEQVVRALSLYMREGTVFAVDTRLRPHGQSGELVNTPAQLQAYFATDAKPWEALTYLRLRYIAGDESVAKTALAAVRESLLPAICKRASTCEELAEVRRKLEESDRDPNLKTGPGGVYDIDYVLGILQIRASCPMSANLSDRIKAVCDCGLLSRREGDTLARNAAFLRNLEHAIRLVTGNASKWVPASEHARSSVAELMQPAMSSGADLQKKLENILRENREIYLKYNKP